MAEEITESDSVPSEETASSQPPAANPHQSTETVPNAGPSSASPTQPPSSGAQAAPDGPQERKARGFVEQAEKKIKSSQTFFGGLFGYVLG